MARSGSLHRWFLVVLVAGVACACVDVSAERVEPATAAARASAAATPAPSAGGVDRTILRAARTPISFRATATAVEVAASGPREAPSLVPLVAGIDDPDASPSTVATAAVPVPDPTASAGNSARRSISQMGLILTRKIVLPAYPSRKSVDDGQKLPGPEKPSGTDRTPAPSPERMNP